MGIWAELLLALGVNNNSTQRPKTILIIGNFLAWKKIVHPPIGKGRIIVVLPSAKLILPVDRGIFTSGGIFLTKLNQFITKKKFS